MNNSEKTIIKYKYCKNKKLLKWYSNQILFLNILGYIYKNNIYQILCNIK